MLYKVDKLKGIFVYGFFGGIGEIKKKDEFEIELSIICIKSRIKNA